MHPTKRKPLPLWIRLALGIFAALLVGALVLILTVRTPYSPEELFENTEAETETNSTNSLFGNPKYTSPHLVPVAFGVVEVFGPEGNCYRAPDELLYTVGKDSPLQEAPAEELWVFGNCIVYRDTLQALHGAVSGKEYLCPLVEGDPVAAYTDGNGLFWIFSFKETQLYLNRVSAAGEKVEYNNTPLSLSADGKRYESLQALQRCGTEDGLFYAEAEGRRFCGRFSALQTDGSPSISVTPLPEEANRFFNTTLSEGEAIPIYSKKEDNSHLYFTEKGIEKSVALPAGYSVDRLKQVGWGRTDYLWMEDGTVFWKKGDSFEKAPADLTHALALYSPAKNTLRVLMEDGVLYEMTQSKASNP